MTKEQVENILSLAKGGDVRKAVEAEFVEKLGSIAGCEASIGAIVAEVEQWRDADEETRNGIEAYKAAKLAPKKAKKAKKAKK